MSTKQSIEKKIQTLGGTKKNPSIKKDNAVIKSSDFIELEKKYGEKIPESYKITYIMYGPFSFNNKVKVQCVDPNPVSGPEKWVSADYFYSIKKDEKCSIDEILLDHAELLDKKLLPICDGEPGDLICIDLNNGNIDYWYHEGTDGDNLFLIAENFEDFIFKLEISEDIDDNSKSVENMQVKASSQLLEMLKKSGFGPKNK